ncbi:MAG TPA: hypothetical protein VFV50_07260 [Bdellovibrionales bacterium]|nr:hypothetical protein [Bdellovibrionales bacterium]
MLKALILFLFAVPVAAQRSATHYSCRADDVASKIDAIRSYSTCLGGYPFLCTALLANVAGRTLSAGYLRRLGDQIAASRSKWADFIANYTLRPKHWDGPAAKRTERIMQMLEDISADKTAVNAAETKRQILEFVSSPSMPLTNAEATTWLKEISTQRETFQAFRSPPRETIETYRALEETLSRKLAGRGGTTILSPPNFVYSNSQKRWFNIAAADFHNWPPDVRRPFDDVAGRFVDDIAGQLRAGRPVTDAQASALLDRLLADNTMSGSVSPTIARRLNEIRPRLGPGRATVNQLAAGSFDNFLTGARDGWTVRFREWAIRNAPRGARLLGMGADVVGMVLTPTNKGCAEKLDKCVPYGDDCRPSYDLHSPGVQAFLNMKEFDRNKCHEFALTMPDYCRYIDQLHGRILRAPEVWNIQCAAGGVKSFESAWNGKHYTHNVTSNGGTVTRLTVERPARGREPSRTYAELNEILTDRYSMKVIPPPVTTSDLAAGPAAFSRASNPSEEQKQVAAVYQEKMPFIIGEIADCCQNGQRRGLCTIESRPPSGAATGKGSN